MCVVGTGTTVTITTLTTPTDVPVGRVVSIGGFSQTIGDLEDNDLATTGHMKFCPSTLIDHGEITITAAFLEDATVMPSLGTTADILIDFPEPGGSLSTGATLTGSGWLKGLEWNGAEYDQRLEATFTWRFSGRPASPDYLGETHALPTFTPPSA